MDLLTTIPSESKMRIIQETVPGNQIILAHIIANADSIPFTHPTLHHVSIEK